MFGQRAWNPYGKQFFSPDDESGGGGEQKPDAKPDDPLAGLTDAQKAVIQRQIDSAASAARKAGEQSGLTKAQQDANAKAESDRIAKEQADAIKAGEFETAKGLIEKDRDDAKAEAKTHADKLERAENVLKNVVADRKKALDATGDKELIGAFPADADPLAQLEWLDDPRTKAAMKTAAAEKAEIVRVPGTPKPNGALKPEFKSLVNTKTF